MKARYITFFLSAALIPLLSFGEVNFLLSPDTGGGKRGGLMDSPPTVGGLSFGLGFAPLVGVEAKFSGLGAFRPPLSPQPPGGGQNYNYDDGFVHLDATGNAGGNTWNWGYDDAAQFNPAGGGSVSMATSSVLRHGEAKGSDDFAPGIEAFAFYDLGELPGLNLGAGPARWGLKATLHYADISIDDSGPVFAGVSRVTDTFSLNGVVPPLAPYTGSFNGPGPLLSDNPTRVTRGAPNGASVAGNREVGVDLFGLTVGPRSRTAGHQSLLG